MHSTYKNWSSSSLWGASNQTSGEEIAFLGFGEGRGMGKPGPSTRAHVRPYAHTTLGNFGEGSDRMTPQI